MCPGGTPCATNRLNGWSPSKGSGYHNSGIVVELKLEDFSRLQNTVLWLEWNSKSIEQKLGIWLVKLKGFLRNA
jgi:hypothetical protein